MKKNILAVALLGAATLMSSCGSSSSMLSGLTQSAQSSTTTSNATSSLLTSGLGNLLGALTGGSTVTQNDLLGTWKYKGADCVFKTENLLMKAGGEVAATQVETKVNEYLTKFGLTGSQFEFTFNKDNTYSANIKGRALQGTYSFDAESKKVTLTYLNGLGTISPQVAKNGNTISLLYEADALMNFLTKVSAASNNATISTLSNLLKSYDGMLIGWELQK
ncbi:MAG: DUF4923 family protein [Bacteroidaceae bacterium]|nr:DUF4923 family protein [Bacteroidaceae bacterium]